MSVGRSGRDGASAAPGRRSRRRSLGFALYPATFSTYGETYGSIGAILVLFVWLWLSNSAVLLGAELDRTRDRARNPKARHAAAPKTALLYTVQQEHTLRGIEDGRDRVSRESSGEGGER